MIGVPPEGRRFYTFVGTGLANPTQVLARSTGASMEILAIVKQGDATPEEGEMYSVSDSTIWKPEGNGPF